MDLNKLYFHHQLAVMRADASIGHGERAHHEGFADVIADRIGGYQRKLGAAASVAWTVAQLAPAR
ncbi:MAG: hypothetical protein KGL44_08870 [Sphingomonadales bacterium]|nr:hypothetical protein [Sphingomonadales bacterium]